MTAPTNAVEGTGGRHYTHPHRPGVDYLSVTTAISNGVPKQLNNWLTKTTATYCVDNLQLLGGLDRDAAIDLAKRECDRIRDAAGDRGTITHTLVEAAGKLDPGAHATFEEFKAAALGASGIWVSGVEGYVDAGLRFLWDWRPTVAAAEITVYSHRHRYAGTADLFATLPGLGGGILDWKTSSDIYPETALQLAAYRFADEALIDGQAVPVPDVTFAAAIHLRPDGTYNVVVLKAGPDEHRLFLGALDTARFVLEGSKEVRLAEYTSPPPERPWWATAERRAWVVARIETLRDAYPAGLGLLAACWPAGVPTFKQAEQHTTGQLAAIAAVLDGVEAELGVPFGPNDPVPSIAGVPLADSVDCQQVAARIAALPTDLAGTVESAMHRAQTPKLTSGRTTVEHLAAIEEVLAPAEMKAAQRQAALFEILGDYTRDPELVGAIVVHASGGRHGDPARMTEDHLERAQLLAHAIDSGAIVLGYDEHARPVFNVPPATEARLLIGHGNSKATLLAAGRDAAKALGLPTPRGSAQVCAEPLIVARLAELVGSRAA
jgi:hypothetical protein